MRYTVTGISAKERFSEFGDTAEGDLYYFDDYSLAKDFYKRMKYEYNTVILSKIEMIEENF